MTHYHFDNQVKKKKFSRVKIAGIVFVVIIGLVVLFGLGKLIQTIARGPQWLHDSAATTLSNEVSKLSPKSVLIAKITALQNQVQDDQEKLTQLQVLQTENDALRTELSYQKNPKSVITAQVLAKPSQSLYNSLIIDRGTADGILVGQLVTAQGFVGLGTVVTVSYHTATVQLFSGPQFSQNLVLQGQNITLPAVGKGGGTFQIDIPHTTPVIVGDTLVFPNDPSVAVATVASIIFDPRDPFQTVIARVPVNIQQLDYVEVVK